MIIGIVIAIERELKSFLESKYEVSLIQDKCHTVYKTKVNDNDVYVIKSGCGEIDAAGACQYLITKYDVEVILNYGVTGALKKELKVSDLFVVKGAINHDFDISGIDNVKPCQYTDLDSPIIPLDADLITLAKDLKNDLKECVVASGESFIDKLEDKERLAGLGCDICDMEIAAISRICLLNKVKCLSIKCISDTLDGDGSMFEKNVKEASDKAFDLLSKILKAL